jgi:hypothetical protein
MDLPPATCGKSNSCRGRGVLARDSSTRPPPRNTLGYQDLHAAPDCGRRVHRLVVGRRKVAGGSDSNFHFIICTLRPLLPKWHFTTVGSDHLGWGRTAQLNSKLCEPMAVDVSSWHVCDMPTSSSNVGRQQYTGKHLLRLSSSQFDPEPTWVAEQRRAAETRRLLSATSYDTI